LTDEELVTTKELFHLLAPCEAISKRLEGNSRRDSSKWILLNADDFIHFEREFYINSTPNAEYYKEAQQIEIKPLDWWQRNQKKYPISRKLEES